MTRGRVANENGGVRANPCGRARGLFGCRVVRNGPVRLDRLDVWQGTTAEPVDLDLIEAHVPELGRSFRARVVGDPWQAAAMYQRLRRRGLPVHEHAFTTNSWTTLATGLCRAVRDRRLDLPSDDAELLDELAAVKIIEKGPGVYRLDHAPGAHDDRVVALALAAVPLFDAGPTRARIRSVARMVETAGIQRV